MRIFPIIALSGLLAGCAAMQERENERLRAEAVAYEANADAQCRSYGAQPGTPVYIQCRMNMDNRRAQMAENDRVMATQYLLSRR